jgi:hypothetical protein
VLIRSIALADPVSGLRRRVFGDVSEPTGAIRSRFAVCVGIGACTADGKRGVTVPQIVESSDGIGAAKAATAQHEHDDPPWMDRRSSQPHDPAFADSLGMTVNNVFNPR